MTSNPEYSRWISVDQLLMGWMYSSMTSDIVIRVMGCNSSSELWKAINENYRILNSTIKQLADNLEIAENKIDHANLVTQVLARLNEEYTSIIVQVNCRDQVSCPNLVEDQAWYADSGASHHVTTNKNNVDEAKEYGGKQKMVVGNGTSLQISHVGSKVFDIESDKSFVLKTLLHVPKIKKNLISVSKLTTDNNVSVEFFPNGCVVKDLPTRRL
ncbi:Retrovirus-related Pol polyprotein from transposon TNT 1-94 [Abeliophyllum distichum]|uniref:Retrovirus-related Pol polyprotein from transposon TNT 1-94 n=1 Tax=Abeliophyllum distichum TaxID=126358 RepID=A0ABD1Q3W2_9LAMI